MNKDYILEKLIENEVDFSYIYAVFYNKVIFGYYDKNDIVFYDDVNYDLCIQMRFFNSKMEYRIVNVDNEIYYKKIVDDDYIYQLEDEYMFLSLNTLVKQENNFSVLEGVNRRIVLPFIISEEEALNHIRLVVRNYCDVDDNGQIVICDDRLVGFSKNGVDLIK